MSHGLGSNTLLKLAPLSRIEYAIVGLGRLTLLNVHYHFLTRVEDSLAGSKAADTLIGSEAKPLLPTSLLNRQRLNCLRHRLSSTSVREYQAM